MTSPSACRRTADRLTSYVDDLLPPSDRADVERHLAMCEPCRTAAREEAGARTVLREKADDLRAEPLPPGLRSRCEALAGDPSVRRRPGAWAALARLGRRARAASHGLVPGWLTAILVVLTTLGVFSLATHRSDALLAAQLTADHAKCFRFVAGSSEAAEAAQIERMLRDRYGWDVHVPPSSPADGVQLIGARRCLYADGLVPHIMYRTGGQDVSLYMLDGVARGDADVVSLGHRSRIWSRGATTYVMVSAADADGLAAATRYLMQDAH